MSTVTVPATCQADAGALLSQAGTGSTEAFATLYDLVAPLVHGLSIAALLDPATAERATEAVFLQLWRQAPRYRPDQHEPIPWILALAYQVLAHTSSTSSTSSTIRPERPSSTGTRARFDDMRDR